MEESEDRRKRLKLLRDKRDANATKNSRSESKGEDCNQAGEDDSENLNGGDSNERKEKKLIFRNYRPATISISSSKPLENVDGSSENKGDYKSKQNNANVKDLPDQNDELIRNEFEPDQNLESTSRHALPQSESKYKTIASSHTSKILKDELEKEMKRAANSSQSKAKFEKSLMPNKINWDLKRGVEKRLALLEKRTEKAIIELLREKIDAEESTEEESDDSEDGSDID